MTCVENVIMVKRASKQWSKCYFSIIWHMGTVPIAQKYPPQYAPVRAYARCAKTRTITAHCARLSMHLFCSVMRIFAGIIELVLVCYTSLQLRKIISVTYSTDSIYKYPPINQIIVTRSIHIDPVWQVRPITHGVKITHLRAFLHQTTHLHSLHMVKITLGSLMYLDLGLLKR